MSLFGLSSKKEDAEESGISLTAISPEEIYEKAKMELRDILAPSALEISPKSIHLGDKIARTYFVVSYPSFLSDNWFTQIINLDKIFDVSIYIHPVDTAKLLKIFEKKVAEVESQIIEREEKGMVRDPKLDTAYRNIENLRDSLIQAQQKVFDMGIYITIYADDETDLFKTENEIRSILESQMVIVKPALFQQEEGFLSIIPLNKDHLEITTQMNTEPVASTFPFVSFDLTSSTGIMYGVNRHNASLVIFDRFSLENFNSVTIATSGSGKSFANKLEILRSLMFGTDVIVIDPEREYEYLAEAVGGRYFNISLSSDHHINPFDLPIVRDDENPSDVLRSQIISLVGLFRLMLGGLTPEEDSIVDRAVSETYALKDITPESDFSKIEPPLLSDFEMVLAGMDGSESVLQRLRKFTTGSWANFINQPSNVDINKKLVVFSIRDMEEELKPIAMYIVTHYIWNSIRQTLKKRLLVVDEAWVMMKSPDTASFLFGIAKRGRKYYLGLSVISQNIDDFMKNEYGVAIVTNSAMQLLLKQSPSSIDLLQKTFHLTDQEKLILLESNVGEGIFFAGKKHVAIKVLASYTEQQIITSDPEQILAIRKAKEVTENEEQRLKNSLNEDISESIQYKETENKYEQSENSDILRENTVDETIDQQNINQEYSFLSENENSNKNEQETQPSSEDMTRDKESMPTNEPTEYKKTNEVLDDIARLEEMLRETLK